MAGAFQRKVFLHLWDLGHVQTKPNSISFFPPLCFSKKSQNVSWLFRNWSMKCWSAIWSRLASPFLQESAATNGSYFQVVELAQFSQISFFPGMGSSPHSQRSQGHLEAPGPVLLGGSEHGTSAALDGWIGPINRWMQPTRKTTT